MLNNSSNFLHPANASSTHSTKAQDLPFEILQWRLSEDCTVRIQFNGSVTQEAIKKLIAILELNTDVYPTKQLLKEHDKGRSEFDRNHNIADVK
ncbi:hypothetical protein [Coleofasciculus sp. FACHB-T130]|uniref:hypothetical protein n=1 Tax=Cyanophyceae TaxID=3028117 RepID=UPI001689E1A1|nr:hypothetical protein [Coleofasciculus sp. FACHB-T130]MBD1879072.1 hypothetical protein [Coleofasciculus sp. FACHB-T130]